MKNVLGSASYSLDETTMSRLLASCFEFLGATGVRVVHGEDGVWKVLCERAPAYASFEERLEDTIVYSVKTNVEEDAESASYIAENDCTEEVSVQEDFSEVYARSIRIMESYDPTVFHSVTQEELRSYLMLQDYVRHHSIDVRDLWDVTSEHRADGDLDATLRSQLSKLRRHTRKDIENMYARVSNAIREGQDHHSRFTEEYAAKYGVPKEHRIEIDAVPLPRDDDADY